MFYSFYSPIIVVLLLLFTCLLFIVDKRGLYTKYRAISKVNTTFYRKFMNLFLLYFSSLLLFIFCYGVANSLI